MRFPDVAASVVHLLMDFLGDLNTAPALDVVFFVREIMETNPKLRPTILARLLDSFGTIRSSRVCTCALWIVGEYCTSAADISAALEVAPQLRVVVRALSTLLGQAPKGCLRFSKPVPWQPGLRPARGKPLPHWTQ